MGSVPSARDSNPPVTAFNPAQTSSDPKMSRSLILCFDGTGNKFGEVRTNLVNGDSRSSAVAHFGQRNSNVLRFFHALKKDQPEKQAVYYQPGIGTYNKRHFITRTISAVSASLDQGIALYLNDHVKRGYQFIMRNHRSGDKICLFGFSRGAYTARVLAGMLYKVGILPVDNIEQVDFAFSVYQTTGDEGTELGKQFQRTFSATKASVEFLGAWDTVSSVGVIPRSYPYTSANYAVKTFRHALALDERRARFRPEVWIEPTLDHDQDLDVDDPEVFFPPSDMEERNEWEFNPPLRNVCDVEEVWFTGCHSDVGGGYHSNNIYDVLSYIPLRWMIKECLLKTDILFDLGQLVSYGLSIEKLEEIFATFARGRRQRLGFNENSLAKFRGKSDIADIGNFRYFYLGVPRLRVWDQLDLVIYWWILEFIPTLTIHQDRKSSEGDWIRRRERNCGRGRFIPSDPNRLEVKVHSSVRRIIEDTERDPAVKTYQPAACDWSYLLDTGSITWVD